MTRSDPTQSRLLRTVQLAMFAAIAYALAAAAHFFMPPLIPAAPFLKYDPKDVVVAIAAFLYGPLPGALVSLLVSLLEMWTISSTGLIGCVMNVLSTVCFVCPAAWWYSRRRRLSSAVLGLIVGTLLTAGVMVLWNYLLTPLYTGMPREQIVPLLLTAFLPFNLLKGAANAALTLLLYKPLRTALQKARLLPAPATETAVRKRPVGLWLLCGLVLVTCVLLALSLAGIF